MSWIHEVGIRNRMRALLKQVRKSEPGPTVEALLKWTEDLDCHVHLTLEEELMRAPRWLWLFTRKSFGRQYTQHQVCRDLFGLTPRGAIAAARRFIAEPELATAFASVHVMSGDKGAQKFLEQLLARSLKPKPTSADRASAREVHARQMLASWERRIARAETLRSKWAAKVAYYDKKHAARGAP